MLTLTTHLANPDRLPLPLRRSQTNPAVQLPPAPTVVAGAATLTYSTTKNTAIALPDPGALANQHFDGSGHSLELVGAPLHGSANLTGASFTYTPAQGFSGVDTFKLAAVLPVCGGATAIRSSGNVTVTVTGRLCGCEGRLCKGGTLLALVRHAPPVRAWCIVCGFSLPFAL